MRLKAEGWLKRATREQKETLIRDLNRVTRIIQEIQQTIPNQDLPWKTTK
jgi:predicted GIY-YIG superfamily endonuclease